MGNSYAKRRIRSQNTKTLCRWWLAGTVVTFPDSVFAETDYTAGQFCAVSSEDFLSIAPEDALLNYSDDGARSAVAKYKCIGDAVVVLEQTTCFRNRSIRTEDASAVRPPRTRSD